MRTIVDIPDEEIRALADLCEAEKISRAEAVRRAIRGYLKVQQTQQSDDAFGAWRGRGEDGLTYQERLRSEWDR